MTTENNPSYNITGWGLKRNSKRIPKRTTMKIQAHPAFPPMPFMFSIAAASNPEKAPESWEGTLAAPKKFHLRFCNAPKLRKKIEQF